MIRRFPRLKQLIDCKLVMIHSRFNVLGVANIKMISKVNAINDVALMKILSLDNNCNTHASNIKKEPRRNAARKKFNFMKNI